MRSSRRVSPSATPLAFTLVEALVVSAILAVLLAILLPAIQYARESSRSVQCQSNLRQLALAMASYESSQGVLPLGRVTRFKTFRELYEDATAPPRDLGGPSSPESGWTLLLLPYLAPGAVADQFDQSQGVYGRHDGRPPYELSGVNANHALFETSPAILNCPSDREGTFTFRPLELFRGAQSGATLHAGRGNYAASWGNTNWEQSTDILGVGVAETSVTFLRPAFGVHAVRSRDIRDGLSATVLVSEVLKGSGGDLRGLLWFPAPGANLFMTRFTPNGAQDYLRVQHQGDLLPFVQFCASEPPRLPCSGTEKIGSAFAGARSRHRGGVHAALGDGSVQFVADSVDPALWRSMAGIDDGQR